MKIKSIEIKELYGLYDHKIEFNRNDKIDIVIGQNGIGKTTILKLLYMLFNHQISQIKNVRFKEFIIEFDPGFCLIFKEICKDNSKKRTVCENLLNRFKNGGFVHFLS